MQAANMTMVDNDELLCTVPEYLRFYAVRRYSMQPGVCCRHLHASGDACSSFRTPGSDRRHWIPAFAIPGPAFICNRRAVCCFGALPTRDDSFNIAALKLTNEPHSGRAEQSQVAVSMQRASEE